MAQTLSQTQTQALTQEQRMMLTPQQLLAAKLTSLSLDELRNRVETELIENPWLEKRTLAKPVRRGKTLAIEVGEHSEATSFYDHLMEQVGEYSLNNQEKEVLEYLIGSLNDDGFLSKPTMQIADELEIYHSLPVTVQQVEHALSILQQFDPPGIGARDLKECLLLQHPSRTLRLILEQHWDSFKNKRWDRIQAAMQLTDTDIEHLRREVSHLNPRPGSSLNDSVGRQTQTIKPDFIVEIDQEGVLHLTLNQGDVPYVKVSEDNNLGHDADDIAFVRDYKEKGQTFVDALAQRRLTMLTTMKAIIRLQRAFFKEGDENLLRPMRLEDIAEQTGQDLSTISRVTSSKYVDTPYGIYPLKWFFSHSSIQDGETVSTRKVKNILRQIIDTEDKKNPLSDELLCHKLKEHGFNIARRTIAKYRESLGIPTARMRKY